MQITTILFDLDGTLLPMDQDEFVKTYFGNIAKKLAPYGYEPEKMISTIWAGTKEMIQNDGSKTNEKAFWNKFCEIFGEDAMKDEAVFADFYEHEFSEVQKICGYNEKAKEVVQLAKQKGFRVALATNPLFPAVATKSRICWAGLTPSDFSYITTYENASYCKPNLEYYKGILSQLHVKSGECLMVGNDVTDDMVVSVLGMKTFLLTDCLVNKQEEDISKYPHGNFEELMKYIDKL